MGSRDRPHKEQKKKPKDKSAKPTLQPLSEGPAQAELIRKERKPRWDEDSSEASLTPSAGGDRVPLRRVGADPEER